ncbi:MAG TPA: contractile injection system protein, VgrG/Pvc8 family [Solirubrobacteraceae bacterium]|nr:contractile injection system protein, VgrG/Pvc8 family [Solirubrobacteraceae bacterium]
MIAETVRVSIDGAQQPDLMPDLIAVDVREDVDEGSVFSLRVGLSTRSDGSWSHVDDERFTLWRRVAVEAGYEPPGEKVADGYVTHVDVALTEDGSAQLELSGTDAAALMDLDDKQLAWPNKTDSEIATAIFSAYGLRPDVEDTAVRHEEKASTVLQSETDIRFLRRLAARNAFECRVAGATGVFRAPNLRELPQKPLAIAFGPETNVVDLRLRVDGTAATTPEARRLDPLAKQEERRSAAESSRRSLGRRPLAALRSVPGGRSLVRRHSAGSLPELDALTRAAYTDADRFVALSGEIDSRAYRSVLRPGRLVTVKGAGALYSGLYYVTRVHHSFTVEGYTQRFEAHRNGLGLTGEERFAAAGGIG